MNLADFQIRANAEPRVLDILTARGEHVLSGTLPHFELEPSSGQFDLFNVDLSVTPALAAKWKAPHLDGLVLGTLTLRGTVEMPRGSAAESDQQHSTIGTEDVGVANACNDFSGDVDVAMIGLGSVQQTFRIGNRIAITPSARLKNVGTANVPWHAKFTGNFPPYNIDQHPYLVWAVYRESNGVFEMLGYSDVKHAFLTINSNCSPGACTQSSILGLGCEDVYGVGTNTNHLGPRSEVHPHAGTWDHCDFPAPNTPCHFDQVAPFCSQDNPGIGEDGLQHRAVASDAELSVSGGPVLHRDLVRRARRHQHLQRHGMATALAVPIGEHLELQLRESHAAGFCGRCLGRSRHASAGCRQLHALRPVGRPTFSSRSRTTDLGDGRFRYVYALHNHDYDPLTSSLSFPLPAGATLEQPTFRDGDDDPSNDWVATTTGGSLTWTAPNTSGHQMWGTMNTFEFIVDAAPVAGTAELTRADTGGVFTIDSLVMDGVAGGDFFSDFESGASGWTTSGLWQLLDNSSCADPQPGYSSQPTRSTTARKGPVTSPWDSPPAVT